MRSTRAYSLANEKLVACAQTFERAASCGEGYRKSTVAARCKSDLMGLVIWPAV